MSTMQFGAQTEFSNMCGVTLMNTPIGRVVADVMGAKDGVELTEYPSMIRVDGVNRLEFDYDELTDAWARSSTARSSRRSAPPITGGWCTSTIGPTCSRAPRTPPSSSGSISPPRADARRTDAPPHDYV